MYHSVHLKVKGLLEGVNLPSCLRLGLLLIYVHQARWPLDSRDAPVSTEVYQ